MNVKIFATAMLFATSNLLAGAGMAEVFPSKPVHLVVPFPAGGVTDILARTLAHPHPS